MTGDPKTLAEATADLWKARREAVIVIVAWTVGTWENRWRVAVLLAGGFFPTREGIRRRLVLRRSQVRKRWAQFRLWLWDVSHG